jgi:hypothetical protein
MDIENDQIINSAEADAAVDSTYVVVSIILIFLFGLGLCALEGSFINYDLAIRRFDFDLWVFRTSHGWRPPTSSLNSMRAILGLAYKF